jgi:hypothetical protein
VLVRLQDVQNMMTDPAKREGVRAGAMLAQAFGHMTANAVWLKPVETRRAQEKKLTGVNSKKAIPEATRLRVCELFGEWRDSFPSANSCYLAIEIELGLNSGQARYIIEKQKGRR